MFNVIINQIIILSIAVLIGFLARKYKLLDENVKHGLSKVVIKITFPLLIITSITNLDITGKMLKDAVKVLLFAYLFIFLLFIAGIMSGKLFKLKGVAYNTHCASIMFGNVIFLGFPLFTAMYPNGEGVFYAIFFYLASDSLLWTLGVILLNKHNAESKVGLSHLLNPNSIAFALGLIMLFLGVKLPSVINTAFSGIGHTTSYLAMLFIGITLSEINIKTIYKKPSVFALSFLKTVIIPIVAMFIMKAVISFGIILNNVALTVLILQVAMPCMVTVSVVAKESNADYVYVTECIFLSTLISLVSIPFNYYIIEQLLL